MFLCVDRAMLVLAIVVALSFGQGVKHPAIPAWRLAPTSFEVTYYDLGGAQQYTQEILKVAQATGLEPELISAVAQVESCSAHHGGIRRYSWGDWSPCSRVNPWARGAAGEYGLLQVMPYHYRSNPSALYDPYTNLVVGSAYLKQMIAERGGSVYNGLSAYNKGPAWPYINHAYSGKAMAYYDSSRPLRKTITIKL